MLDAAARDEEAAHTRTKLAAVLISENRLEQARELLEQAQRKLNDPPALAKLAARRAQLAFLTDDFHRAREQAELALSIADPRELHSVVAEASLTKAIALYYDGRLTEAGALMKLGLEVAVEHDLTEQTLRGYYNLADFTMLNGDPAESARLLSLGVALARERGDRAWSATCSPRRRSAKRLVANGTRRWQSAGRFRTHCTTTLRASLSRHPIGEGRARRAVRTRRMG